MKTDNGDEVLKELEALDAERRRAEDKLRCYQARLRSLASELVLAQERERCDVATWLHGNLAQVLAVLRMKLVALRETVSSPDTARPLDQSRAILDQVIHETRSLTFELGSPILYELGLEAALERLVERFQEDHGILSKFESDTQPKPLNGAIRTTLFRAVRELLVNVAKHARASNVDVRARKGGGAIRIDVADDGVGFDISTIDSHVDRASGFGLFSIRERLKCLGGEFRIESGQGLGTCATVVAPLEHDQTADAGTA